MTRAQIITDLLTQALATQHIDVLNESHRHAVAPGSETHFKVTIVSSAFASQPLITRHRTINTLLKPLFEQGLHALSLHTYTPEQWTLRNTKAPKSPPCLGGEK